MSATKRSRKSGARVLTKRSKSSKKTKLNNAVTNDKHLVAEEENIEQKTQVAKGPERNQTSEGWTPYFKSKRLRSLSRGENMQSAVASDEEEEAGDSQGLETAAMQECQSIRRALIQVLGFNGQPLTLETGKLQVELLKAWIKRHQELAVLYFDEGRHGDFIDLAIHAQEGRYNAGNLFRRRGIYCRSQEEMDAAEALE